MSDNEDASKDPFTEYVEPETGEVLRSDRPTHMDRTRRSLAVGAMLLLAVLAIGGLAGWLWGDRTTSEVQSFSVIFSPVVALLGPILGFYFSRSQK